MFRRLDIGQQSSFDYPQDIEISPESGDPDATYYFDSPASIDRNEETALSRFDTPFPFGQLELQIT